MLRTVACQDRPVFRGIRKTLTDSGQFEQSAGVTRIDQLALSGGAIQLFEKARCRGVGAKWVIRAVQHVAGPERLVTTDERGTVVAHRIDVEIVEIMLNRVCQIGSV